MTESHLRRLSVTMRILEDALVEIETGLSNPPKLLMTVVEDDLPHSAHPAIQEHLKRIRNEIRVVRDRYKLNPQVFSNCRRISAKLSYPVDRPDRSELALYAGLW